MGGRVSRVAIMTAAMLLVACGSEKAAEAYDYADAVRIDAESAKAVADEAMEKAEELERKVDQLEYELGMLRAELAAKY